MPKLVAKRRRLVLGGDHLINQDESMKTYLALEVTVQVKVLSSFNRQDEKIVRTRSAYNALTE